MNINPSDVLVFFRVPHFLIARMFALVLKALNLEARDPTIPALASFACHLVGGIMMPRLTRRRDPDARMECWQVLCGDIAVGKMGMRSGVGSRNLRRALATKWPQHRNHFVSPAKRS